MASQNEKKKRRKTQLGLEMGLPTSHTLPLLFLGQLAMLPCPPLPPSPSTFHVLPLHFMPSTTQSTPLPHALPPNSNFTMASTQLATTMMFASFTQRWIGREDKGKDRMNQCLPRPFNTSASFTQRWIGREDKGKDRMNQLSGRWKKNKGRWRA